MWAGRRDTVKNKISKISGYCILVGETNKLIYR